MRWSPYWRTPAGCVSRTPEGLTQLDVPRAGLVQLSFTLGVTSSLGRSPATRRRVSAAADGYHPPRHGRAEAAHAISSQSSGPSSTGSVSTFDPASLETRLVALEEQMNAPGLLGRPGAGGARLRRARARLAPPGGLPRLPPTTTDAQELATLDGGEMEGEIAAVARAAARASSSELQEAALFDGEYDAGDAVVTLQSGTGGTDAQDWAEMMLRMYERWAANRGFGVELLEASPGEEAGLKSATFTVAGENAYGILKAERGKHRLVRLSPVRPGAPPPHRVLDGDRRAAPARRRRRRDRRGRPEDRHVPRAGRRRPAREQDRQRRPDHAPADRHRRRSARTSARSRRTSRRRCAC